MLSPFLGDSSPASSDNDSDNNTNASTNNNNNNVDDNIEAPSSHPTTTYASVVGLGRDANNTSRGSIDPEGVICTMELIKEQREAGLLISPINDRRRLVTPRVKGPSTYEGGEGTYTSGRASTSTKSSLSRILDSNNTNKAKCNNRQRRRVKLDTNNTGNNKTEPATIFNNLGITQRNEKENNSPKAPVSRLFDDESKRGPFNNSNGLNAGVTFERGGGLYGSPDSRFTLPGSYPLTDPIVDSGANQSVVSAGHSQVGGEPPISPPTWECP